MKKILVLLLLVVGFTGRAQQILPEKFDDCKSAGFGFESDKVIAKIDNKKLVEVVFGSLDEQAREVFEGHLLMQINVGLDGYSCLVSMDNHTNIPTSQMRLKEMIDSLLVWEKPDKEICVMVLCVIGKNGVAVKRLGKQSKGGWQALDIQ